MSEGDVLVSEVTLRGGAAVRPDFDWDKPGALMRFVYEKGWPAPRLFTFRSPKTEEETFFEVDGLGKRRVGTPPAEKGNLPR